MALGSPQISILMNTINKEQVVERLQQKFGITKKDARAILGDILDQITTAVADGNRVTFMGFGTFEPVLGKERKARNLSSEEPMIVPPTVRPKFKPGTDFIELVKDRFTGEQPS